MHAPNPKFLFYTEARSKSAIMTFSSPNVQICVLTMQASMNAFVKMLLISASPRRYKMSHVPTACITSSQRYHYLTYGRESVFVSPVNLSNVSNPSQGAASSVP